MVRALSHVSLVLCLTVLVACGQDIQDLSTETIVLDDRTRGCLNDIQRFYDANTASIDDFGPPPRACLYVAGCVFDAPLDTFCDPNDDSKDCNFAGWSSRCLDGAQPTIELEEDELVAATVRVVSTAACPLPQSDDLDGCEGSSLAGNTGCLAQFDLSLTTQASRALGAAGDATVRLSRLFLEDLRLLPVPRFACEATVSSTTSATNLCLQIDGPGTATINAEPRAFRRLDCTKVDDSTCRSPSLLVETGRQIRFTAPSVGECVTPTEWSFADCNVGNDPLTCEFTKSGEDECLSLSLAAINTWRLDVTVTGETGQLQSIEVSPDDGCSECTADECACTIPCQEGNTTTATITAQVARGYELTWQGCTSTERRGRLFLCYVDPTEDIAEITASIAEKFFTVSVGTSELCGEALEFQPTRQTCDEDCEVTLRDGTMVNIQLSASQGSQILDWQCQPETEPSCVTLNGGSATFELSGDVTITPIVGYAVAIESSPAGLPNVDLQITCEQETCDFVQCGKTVTLVASPSSAQAECRALPLAWSVNGTALCSRTDAANDDEPLTCPTTMPTQPLAAVAEFGQRRPLTVHGFTDSSIGDPNDSSDFFCNLTRIGTTDTTTCAPILSFAEYDIVPPGARQFVCWDDVVCGGLTGGNCRFDNEPGQCAPITMDVGRRIEVNLTLTESSNEDCTLNYQAPTLGNNCLMPWPMNDAPTITPPPTSTETRSGLFLTNDLAFRISGSEARVARVRCESGSGMTAPTCAGDNDVDVTVDSGLEDITLNVMCRAVDQRAN